MSIFDVDKIFFDLDGTLVDSRGDIVTAVNHMLAELGFEKKPFELIVSYIGGGVDDLIEKSLEDENERFHDKAKNIFDDFYKDHSTDKSVLYPNVREVLEHFSGKELVIVTNRSKKLSELTLKELDIERYFANIVGGDDPGCLKPSSCQLDRALEDSSEAWVRRRTVMVGDMASDVESAKSAGILSCGVTYGIGKRTDIEKSDPDIIIDDMSELKDLLR